MTSHSWLLINRGGETIHIFLLASVCNILMSCVHHGQVNLVTTKVVVSSMELPMIQLVVSARGEQWYFPNNYYAVEGNTWHEGHAVESLGNCRWMEVKSPFHSFRRHSLHRIRPCQSKLLCLEELSHGIIASGGAQQNSFLWKDVRAVNPLRVSQLHGKWPWEWPQ